MNRLLYVEQKLCAAQTQTHLRYSVAVPDSCGRLNIDFEYSPKQLDDEEAAKAIIRESLLKYGQVGDRSFEESSRKFLPLKNLITVSVDDPNGFRGACHRQPSVQKLHLAPDSASPGLMPGELPGGVWTVTLSIHALVTESCDIRLSVWEGEESC